MIPSAGMIDAIPVNAHEHLVVLGNKCVRFIMACVIWAGERILYDVNQSP